MILHVEYPAKPNRKEGGWATLARWLGWAALGIFAVLIVMALLVAFTAAAVADKHDSLHIDVAFEDAAPGVAAIRRPIGPQLQVVADEHRASLGPPIE